MGLSCEHISWTTCKEVKVFHLQEKDKAVTLDHNAVP